MSDDRLELNIFARKKLDRLEIYLKFAQAIISYEKTNGIFDATYTIPKSLIEKFPQYLGNEHFGPLLANDYLNKPLPGLMLFISGGFELKEKSLQTLIEARDILEQLEKNTRTLNV